LTDTLKEKSLLFRVQTTRDREAFAELVALNQSRLRLFLLRLCRNHALADDIAQETFVTAYQRIGTFTGTGSFQGWLIRIAHRRFLLHLRQEKREQRVLSDLQQSTGPDAHHYEAITPLQKDLERAFSSLTPGEAATITLCHSYGFSHQEVADILDTPLGTVKSQIRRGLEKLRSILVETPGTSDTPDAGTNRKEAV
jgi:RNA polymerase sigma-70 factor (ECF subfamily)